MTNDEIDTRIEALQSGDSNDSEIDGLTAIVRELQEEREAAPVLTLTPAQLDAIRDEVLDIRPLQPGNNVEIRIAPRAGKTRLVTLDAGWGTYTFYATVDGEKVQAGMGETVDSPVGEPTIHSLFADVTEHPDFAGGTIFTKEDVADALFEPEDGWGDGPDAKHPDDFVAQVTEEQRDQAIDTIESYIFNGAYSWRDALRDNVDVTVPA